MRWLVPEAAADWMTDASVTVATSTDKSAGVRLHVLHNWSWDEATASPSSAVTDLLSGDRRSPGEVIMLKAWDVRLLGSNDEPEPGRGG
jgi:beta-galactosidase